MNSISAFKSRSERIFREANYVVTTITWERAVKVTLHDGSRGYTGRFLATAKGYRPKLMTATWSPTMGLTVR